MNLGSLSLSKGSQTTMDKIVLLAKQPGITSFTSLYNVKRAFNTTKVGHTGTLDNFAQGLLVVCTGRLTKLAGNIIELDKSYKAVIRFGTETDTLDYEGEVVKQADLPDEETVRKVVESFTGEQDQKPPVYSAIHVDGKRASELVRKGVEVELPSRKICVYSSEILEIEKDDNGKVRTCLIDFSVSKGTYIRCLARDIGQACGSAAHLIGLYRTRIGNFNIEESAGYSFMPVFDIKTCEQFAEQKKLKTQADDKLIQEQIIQTSKDFDEQTAALCGFKILHLKDSQSEQDFRFGRPLHKTFFTEKVQLAAAQDIFAVFTSSSVFCGLLECKDFEKQHLKYKMVIQEQN